MDGVAFGVDGGLIYGRVNPIYEGNFSLNKLEGLGISYGGALGLGFSIGGDATPILSNGYPSTIQTFRISLGPGIDLGVGDWITNTTFY